MTPNFAGGYPYQIECRECEWATAARTSKTAAGWKTYHQKQTGHTAITIQKLSK